jgi:hypothetical protein
MARKHTMLHVSGFKLKVWMDRQRANGAMDIKTVNYPNGSVLVSWKGKVAR